MKKSNIIKIICIVVLVLICLLTFIFFSKEEDSIKNTINYKDLDSEVVKLAYTYLKYNNLDKVSMKFLMNKKLVSDELSDYSCAVFTVDEVYYEDCAEAESLSTVPTLIISVYESEKIKEFSDYVNEKQVLKFELVNVEDENYLGIYTPDDELITSERTLKTSDLETGTYKYMYNDEFIFFSVVMDNKEPIFKDVEVNNGYIKANYIDDNSYDVYVFYTAEEVDVGYDLNYSISYDSKPSCGDQVYTIYYYAKDLAGNVSSIETLNDILIECSDNSFSFSTYN